MELSIGTIGSIQDSPVKGAQEGRFVESFGDMLKQNIQDTNSMLNKADDYIYDFTVNKSRDIHEVMIAVEEASMALNYTMQVRNKIVEAYQELLRMQV